ncbi:hypothetical protein AB0A94_20385, partial [Streptomyces sp. NPDC044984]|uniref:hypothetical protein n=1 Tax=Streptomyces sp. NPDC044984 TaxID=3154335 RepID=UPI0033EB48F6
LDDHGTGGDADEPRAELNRSHRRGHWFEPSIAHRIIRRPGSPVVSRAASSCAAGVARSRRAATG